MKTPPKSDGFLGVAISDLFSLFSSEPMKNTDTPETNHAAFTAIHIDGDGVPTDFARKLERQRNELARIAQDYVDDLDGSGDEAKAKDYRRWLKSILENADAMARPDDA